MNAYIKAKLVEKGWIAADATDATANACLGEKMTSGELDMVTLMQWNDEAKAQASAASKSQNDKQAEFAKAVAGAVGSRLEGAFAQLTAAIIGSKAAPAAQTPAVAPAASVDDIATKALDTANRLAALAAKPVVADSQVDPAVAFKNAGTGSVRVKKATEQFSSTKGKVCWERGDRHGRPEGVPVKMYRGFEGSKQILQQEFDSLSQAEWAKSGAYAKYLMRKAGAPIRLTELDQRLVAELLHEDTFVGIEGNASGRKLTDFEIKAVLDDSTSGGQEAVPEYFDNAIIMTPLLHGELFPYVNVIPMSRGSSVDGFSIGTPTFVSTASGSAISPFTTTSFVSAFDVNIYPASCAVEWGIDFEEDAVPNFGQAVIAQIGQEHLRWLDEQIAIGDGTTEPQGILTATGTGVSAANGTTGALTYADALTMQFGIGKSARNAFGGNRTRYVMHDTNYKLFMSVATGVTGDTRPVFGMNSQSYQLGDYPVSVQNNITVGDMAFCNLAAYRLYRRQGLQFVMEDRGSTLRLANKRLMLARTRWGGKIELATTYIAQMLNGASS